MSTTTTNTPGAARLAALLEPFKAARVATPAPRFSPAVVEAPVPTEADLLPGQPTFGPWAHHIGCACTWCR